MNSITNTLNNKQKQAVTLELDKNALVLAGAGSGKTSVLTRRIAYILHHDSITLPHILALTFTNKAAGEMRERLEILLKQPMNYQNYIGTFHGIFHRILRAHHALVGLDAGFQILDAGDQLTKIKRILKEMGIDDKKFKPSAFAAVINSHKDEGLRADSMQTGHNLFAKKAQEVFARYQQECDISSEIDFAEILLRSYELFIHHPEVLEHYKQQFRYILIDEFQDTNALQYKLVHLLKSADNTIFCVGDDDQSIYGWRGARVENITHLSTDFAPLEIIKLEQNYRSTATILNASNAVIAHNNERMDKSLWTEGNEGEAIDIFIADDEKKEAKFVARSIMQFLKSEPSSKECAVLYRNNALSRAIEEALIKHNITYTIYGGLRFFDRAEVKDGLAYLRLVSNYKDNNAFLRIVNTPTRGISTTTVQHITHYSQIHSVSLFEAAKLVQDELATRAANAVGQFVGLIEEMHTHTASLPLGEALEYIIERSTLLQHYAQDKSDKGRNKLQNLEELVGAATDFINESEFDERTSFISSATLDAGEARTVNTQVKLMTIHAAKGLEFERVFLVGLEEDIFPSMQSKEENGIEEERRLCYVAMTRAKEKLTLSLTRRRFLYGNYFSTILSRFIREIPAEFLRKIIPTEHSQQITKSPVVSASLGEFSSGDKVVHKVFGLGVVTNYEGGENARVEVNFQKAGKKWLIVEYANLTAFNKI